MIVQAYYAPNAQRPTLWDNATQVQWSQITWTEYEEKNFDGFDWHDWATSQERDFKEGQSYLNYVTWVDRTTSMPNALVSMNNIFILNDEGKTIARV